MNFVMQVAGVASNPEEFRALRLDQGGTQFARLPEGVEIRILDFESERLNTRDGQPASLEARFTCAT
jgi:hypothetical protein